MAGQIENNKIILTDVENIDVIATPPDIVSPLKVEGTKPGTDTEGSTADHEAAVMDTPSDTAQEKPSVPLPVVQESPADASKIETPVSAKAKDTDVQQSAQQSLGRPIDAETIKPAPVKALSNEEVTGHTANLWKYLPIPEGEPEPTPEYINGVVKFPGSKVIAARVRGKKHKHEGTNCDDWYEVASLEKITFVAVSDGAGSKKFSRIGARESCRASVGYLVKTVEQLFADKPEIRTNLSLDLSDKKCMDACGMLAGIVQNSVIQAYEAVEAAYYSRSTDPAYSKTLNRGLQFKDLSGTLLIAVLIPVSEFSKEYLVITCQIGDGMIALLNTEGDFKTSLKLMGVPDSGDFSGETDFLTSPQMKNIETLQPRTKISRCVVDTVFVMSDGVADDYFPNETEMRRLYFDLVVNGILEYKGKTLTQATLTPAQMRLFKKIPDPLEYPWVNDQKIKVAIQYTKRICESTKQTLEDIWMDPTSLALAKLELEELGESVDASEKLKIWLDNYVERGSFDDRTLVIVEL